MESNFDYSGGSSGSWWDGLTTITGQILAYKTATAPNAVRWTPYGDGQQLSAGANGELLTRGLSAGADAGLAALIPLALIALTAVLVYRALK